MLKYFGYNLGIFAGVYIIGKIFNLNDRNNPLFNTVSEGETYTIQKVINNSLIGPIVEELLYRVIPYVLYRYIFKFSGKQLFVSFIFISGPFFGCLHIMNVNDKSIYIKVYHSLYAGTMGLILGKFFYETSSTTTIYHVFMNTVIQHSFHNLLCDMLYLYLQ